MEYFTQAEFDEMVADDELFTKLRGIKVDEEAILEFIRTNNQDEDPSL